MVYSRFATGSVHPFALRHLLLYLMLLLTSGFAIWNFLKNGCFAHFHGRHRFRFSQPIPCASSSMHCTPGLLAWNLEYYCQDCCGLPEFAQFLALALYAEIIAIIYPIESKIIIQVKHPL